MTFGDKILTLGGTQVPPDLGKFADLGIPCRAHLVKVLPDPPGGPEMASRPLPGGPSGPPGPPLLSGKIAQKLPQISIFTGIPVKIPPGAAFGGAPGALRAPGRGY